MVFSILDMSAHINFTTARCIIKQLNLLKMVSLNADAKTPQVHHV